MYLFPSTVSKNGSDMQPYTAQTKYGRGFISNTMKLYCVKTAQIVCGTIAQNSEHNTDTVWESNPAQKSHYPPGNHHASHL